jgi:AraC-like DNA-binding protein
MSVSTPTPIRFHDVTAALSPFVLGIFRIRLEKGQLRDPQVILPDGTCCVFLNLGPPITIVDPAGGTSFCRHQSEILARGLVSRPHYLDCSLGADLWGIKFRADLWSSWDQDTPGVNEYRSSPAFVEPFRPLLEICKNGRTEEKILGDLTRELEVLVPKIFTKQNPVFHGVLEEIRYAKGAAKIEEMLSEFDLPYKTAERYFARLVGTTPKDYARILRIANASVEMLIRSAVPTFRLRELGFFDNAHFFKDFRKFYDTSPGRFLKDLPDRSRVLARAVASVEMSLMN